MKFLFVFSVLLITFINLNAVCVSTHINDTLNKVDENNKKQGYWIVQDKTNSYKLEEGRYNNNRKVGIWKGYYPSGKIKHEITYVNGRADGYAKFYYETGIVSEEGIWKGNKWVGEYKYYHTNGNKAYEWQYNESGKRTGEQKYYHENGNLMIIGTWDNGKEKGVIKEYYADGTLKAEKNFNDGKLDASSVKIYKKDGNSETSNSNNTNTVITNNDTEKTNTPVGYFTGTGDHKTYKEIKGEKKIDREGYFQDGKLYNGKKYTYDSSGTLVKITIYQNGRIADIKYPNQD